tara:strand:- start:159 stop:872 length:714 start_codon:yes stop_codon:yes gene_type:complete
MPAMNQLCLTLAYANDWNPTRVLGTVSFSLTSGLCALVVYLCWMRRKRRDPQHGLGLWLGLLFAQIAMVIELQLSSRFDAGLVIRNLITDMDLYENRRQLQAMAFMLIAIPLIATYSTVLYMLRKRGLAVLLTVGGTMASISLFCLPLISLHLVDQIMYHHLGPVMFISLLWFGCAMVTFAGAAKAMVASRNALFSLPSSRDWHRSEPRRSKRGVETRTSPHRSTNRQALHNSGRRV